MKKWRGLEFETVKDPFTQKREEEEEESGGEEETIQEREEEEEFGGEEEIEYELRLTEEWKTRFQNAILKRYCVID